MIILLHVLIAVASIAYTTYTFFAPSDAKLRVSYGFIAATIISGTYLIWAMPAHMLSTCETGLFYLGAMSLAILAIRYRLATVQSTVKNTPYSARFRRR